MNKVAKLLLLVLLATATPCPGQTQPPDTKPANRVVNTSAASVQTSRHRLNKPKRAAAMRLDTWFSLGSPPASSAMSENRPIDTKPVRGGTENITVHGRSYKQDDWRLDAAAKQPQYEASNSDAAQPLVPFPTYTSPDQQRMMSEKTDAIGLCGALGGYVQCPNLPP